ncbi:MAG: cold shock domain-containing protein [Candidatus Yanofskybacteria bacterium]|nr:cold shock domain-containing protein [Candidatus Yanofskybacteria bacterium]
MTGTIKKKIEDRMFGFITPEGESKDLFFHKDALNGVTFEELKEGDAVTFDVVPGKDGRTAAGNVQRA